MISLFWCCFCTYFLWIILRYCSFYFISPLFPFFLPSFPPSIPLPSLPTYLPLTHPPFPCLPTSLPPSLLIFSPTIRHTPLQNQLKSQITPLGFHLAALPINPRIGKLMLFGKEYNISAHIYVYINSRTDKYKCIFSTSLCKCLYYSS